MPPEIDRVGLQDPRAAKEVWIAELQRERLPSARRSALELPSIRLPNEPEALLEIWNDFLDDRVAVRTVVGRVHRVGIAEVRRLLLERDRHDAWEIVRDPGLIEVVPALGTSYRVDVAARAGRRRRREREWCSPVAQTVDGRVVSVRVVAVSLRQQNVRVDVDGASPEPGELLALNSHML